MLLTYKFKLKPNSRQHTELGRILEDQRQLYNAALEERISAYQTQGRTLTKYDQYASLACLRQEVEFSGLPSRIQRGSVDRLAFAFDAFFRRLKSGEKPGFPRFKSANRFRSFSFSEFAGIRFDGKKLRFKGMPGALKVHMHRPMPVGAKILSCQFVKTLKGWNVCFQINVPTAAGHPKDNKVGVDVGIKHLAVLSDGTVIPNPRITKRYEKQLRIKQRKLARANKCSNRRQKTKKELQRVYEKIANTRKTYLNQQSAKITKEYKTIFVEKLQIKNMVRNRYLSKAIHDASWGVFNQMLAYKAEKAGGQVIEVAAKYTSQECSKCGIKTPKLLSERRHSCYSCGLEMDRDLNAAINILNKGVVALETHNVAGLQQACV